MTETITVLMSRSGGYQRAEALGFRVDQATETGALNQILCVAGVDPGAPRWYHHVESGSDWTQDVYRLQTKKGRARVTSCSEDFLFEVWEGFDKYWTHSAWRDSLDEAFEAAEAVLT